MGWSTNDPSDSGVSYLAFPRPLYAFGTPQAVSTETPLLLLTEFGREYQDLTLTLRNHDAASQAAFYLDRSESGAVADSERQTFYVPPLKERRIEFRDVLALFWGISAAGDPDGGFPSLSVSWQLVGRRRR